MGRTGGWLRVALLAVGIAALFVGGTHRAKAASGTNVCGPVAPGVSVWTSVGAPYNLCSSGVIVPEGSTLVLDGSVGGFKVISSGSPLLVEGGTVRTVATSPAATVSFDTTSG